LAGTVQAINEMPEPNRPYVSAEIPHASERLEKRDEGALLVICEGGLAGIIPRPEIVTAVYHVIGALAQGQQSGFNRSGRKPGGTVR
jgi:hypothetical protein